VKPGDTYAMLMDLVALELLGEPTSKHHGGVEWRYGTRGSLSIDLRKGTYYDHEAAQGGGVLDLIVREIGGNHREAVNWLKDNRVNVRPGTKSNGQAKEASYARHDKTEAESNGNSSAGRRIVAIYDYVDKCGKLLFQIVRYDPKDFRQRRPDGNGGWIWNVDRVKQVPYRLPEIMSPTLLGRTIACIKPRAATPRAADPPDHWTGLRPDLRRTCRLSLV
jgi:putative DNA primase/helicase